MRILDSFLDGVIERNDYTAEKAKLMSRKKSLQEQRTALAQGQHAWIEPLRKWVLAARSAGKIADSGSPQEKKVLAHQVFGSNPGLDGKKARGRCTSTWRTTPRFRPTP